MACPLNAQRPPPRPLYIVSLTHWPHTRPTPLRAASHQTDDHVETPYCNSIGCPNGYTPIYNAHDVECDNGKCEEKQCCEAFCSYYACPNNHTPVYGADTIKCDDSGCTTDLCCDKGVSQLITRMCQLFVRALW